MKASTPVASASPSPIGSAPAPVRGWLLACGLLLMLYAQPLFNLGKLSLENDFHSHVLLIPPAAAYLVWLRWKSYPPPSPPKLGWAIGLLGLGLAVLAGYWVATMSGFALAAEDRLAWLMASLLLFIFGLTAGSFGPATLRAAAYPAGFLLFMIPVPTFLRDGAETLLQHGSAAVALGLFHLAGTPVYASGLIFGLPGITVEVAPECSGIRSTLALFITSVAAAYMFLDTPRRRAILALAVLPLALLRNGFRVFVIGQLCVDVGPHMIDSYLHRHGGPVFFALSLIPFSLLLFFLMRSERRARARSVPPPA